MRRILLDAARAKGYHTRGGGAQKVSLDDAVLGSQEPGQDLVALDDARRILSAVDPRKGHVVEMRFFDGASVEETAESLDVSADTIMRDRRLTKAWLLRELRGPATR
ncbi:MAG: ECF-type sigma factor [Acidobacteriota bacterium]